MSQITVGTTATKVVQSAGSISIFNNGTATVYVDVVPTVTTATGLPIGAGSGWTIASDESQTVYAISGSAGQDVRYVVGIL